jgi:hypothetical protein
MAGTAGTATAGTAADTDTTDRITAPSCRRRIASIRTKKGNPAQNIAQFPKSSSIPLRSFPYVPLTQA